MAPRKRTVCVLFHAWFGLLGCALAGGDGCGPPAGRPLVYVYPLNASFRERGFRDCVQEDCAFGTTDQIQGTTYHHSETHELLWMVYTRLLSSPCRTEDPKAAELFFIPTWSHGAVPADRRAKTKSFHDPDARPSACVDENLLLATLAEINPALTAGAPLYPNARRHIKMDVHANIHCEYFRDGGEPQPMGWMAKASIEIRTPSSLQWYALPYPSMYHGPAEGIPARMQQQLPGDKQYLWSYSGSHHGAGKQLRIVLDHECQKSGRCHGHFHPKGAGYLKECGGNLFNKRAKRRHDHGCKATMEVAAKDGTTKAVRIMPMLVDVMQNSVFCAQPEGDTKSRKGLIDSIILGCIPMVFDPFQKEMYMAYVSKEEFESMSVYIPYDTILDVKAGGKQRWELSKEDLANAASRKPVETFLDSLSDDVVKTKQEHLAALAHKFVLGVKDVENDSLDTFLKRVLADSIMLTAKDVLTKKQPAKVNWHDNPGMVDNWRRKEENVKLMALADRAGNEAIRASLKRSTTLIDGLLAVSNTTHAIEYRTLSRMETPSAPAPATPPAPDPPQTTTPPGDLELSPGDFAKLKALADNRGRTVGEIIQTAVKEHIARSKAP